MASCALLIAAPAHADNNDDVFVKNLSVQGITLDRDSLIAAGHGACDGYGTLAIAGLTLQLEGQGLSSGQAAGVIYTGWKMYCPEKIAGLPQLPS
jgi:Protein of unknown function (DUF732)